MKSLIALALLLIAAPAGAEVKAASSAGFAVRSQVIVAATPAETWAALGRIGEWWNRDHTYSGDSRNLRLELKAGGCFCERLPGRDGKPEGGAEHGRVLAAVPNSTLLLDAPLGPLQSEAAVARLGWTLRAVSGGTEVTQSFVAGGYIAAGPETLAPAVDRVLADQLERLKAYLAR